MKGTFVLNRWFTKYFPKFAFWIVIQLLLSEVISSVGRQQICVPIHSQPLPPLKSPDLLQSVPKHSEGRKFINSQGTLFPYRMGKDSNTVTMF